MATRPIAITSAPRATAENQQGTRPVSRYAAVADYWALTKPEINFLIAVATFTGFYLGQATHSQRFPFVRLIHTLLGTLLVASGTGTLNQYIERSFDAQMRRTARRPLVAGKLTPRAVLSFGIALSWVGSAYLAITVNALASLLAIVTLASYLFLFTPLKRKTALSILVGAFPGAMPPLIGWAAAAGKLSLGAWILYAIIFLWQFPHFMAIAWMYREDYDRAGYIVLPLGRARGRFVTLQTMLPLLALLPLSLLAISADHRSIFHYAVFILSLGFFFCAAQFVLRKSRTTARNLLMASIFYLPLLFLTLVVSKV